MPLIEQSTDDSLTHLAERGFANMAEMRRALDRLSADNRILRARFDNALALLNQDGPYLGLILAARAELEAGKAGQ